MPKRKQSGSALDDFSKNAYPLLFKHAGDNLMDHHICLICHPSGKLEVEEGKPLPSYLYKCIASKKNNGELSFKHGFGNLLRHLDGQHSTWKDNVEEAFAKGDTQLKMDGFLDKKASTTYNWMDLLIKHNLPLSYVENKAFAVNGSRPTMSYETFLKRMRLVMHYIEESMRKRLARYL
jgi:hypothetical protein